MFSKFPYRFLANKLATENLLTSFRISNNACQTNKTIKLKNLFLGCLLIFLHRHLIFFVFVEYCVLINVEDYVGRSSPKAEVCFSFSKKESLCNAENRGGFESGMDCVSMYGGCTTSADY